MNELYNELYDDNMFFEDAEFEGFVYPSSARLNYAREKLDAFGEFLCENAEKVLNSETGLTLELTTDFCDSQYDSFTEWCLNRRAM